MYNSNGFFLIKNISINLFSKMLHVLWPHLLEINQSKEVVIQADM